MSFVNFNLLFKKHNLFLSYEFGKIYSFILELGNLL